VQRSLKRARHLLVYIAHSISADVSVGGDNEVQRTMLEIVNQLDGFDSRGNIKVPPRLPFPRPTIKSPAIPPMLARQHLFLE